MKNKLENIKTNIVTGFLGVGKTSAILHLMAQKPPGEAWAVLVNEFGDIGIDGAIYQSHGIAVKEIPGGCMCCAAGVPLQVAVNQVLKEVCPDRLLIEPSGLGHPKRVLDTLRGEYFKQVLDIRSIICLVDPRNLLDSRYTMHENFIDQIALADILVANKTDLCDEVALQAFDNYVSQLIPAKQRIIKTQQGELDFAVLDGVADQLLKAVYPAHHAPFAIRAREDVKELDGSDGYSSIGVKLSRTKVFDFSQLEAFFRELLLAPDVRIKAVLNTNHSQSTWQIFNCAQQQFKSTAIESSEDNRIEVIARAGESSISRQLLIDRLDACLV